MAKFGYDRPKNHVDLHKPFVFNLRLVKAGMNLKPVISLFFLSLFGWTGFAQDTRPSTGVWYNHYEKRNPDRETDFAVKGNIAGLKGAENVFYKYAVSDWHFIRCSPEDLRSLINQGYI